MAFCYLDEQIFGTLATGASNKQPFTGVNLCIEMATKKTVVSVLLESDAVPLGVRRFKTTQWSHLQGSKRPRISLVSTLENETNTLLRAVGHPSTSDDPPHSRRTETLAQLLRKPEYKQLRNWWGRELDITKVEQCRSRWPRGLRRRSAAARLLGLWVRIPPGAWMSVCCECCVLSGGGLCDGLITRPEESYRLWCVDECDLETSRMWRSWPTGDCCARRRRRRRRTVEQWQYYNSMGLQRREWSDMTGT